VEPDPVVGIAHLLSSTDRRLIRSGSGRAELSFGSTVSEKPGNAGWRLLEHYPMNTANLQLEGLYLAIASINSALVRKGLLTVEEVDMALRRAEANAIGEDRLTEDLSPANRDAVCFPIRLLQIANNSQAAGDVPQFSELARLVGETKRPYNDQM
jgi:hypothetical protein